MFEQLCAVIRQAGEMICNARDFEVEVKEGHANFATTVDAAVESFLKEKLAVLLRHARMLSELKGESVAVREMRRHIVCYVRGMRDAAKVRTKVNTILTLEELEEVLTAFMLKTE